VITRSSHPSSRAAAALPLRAFDESLPISHQANESSKKLISARSLVWAALILMLAGELVTLALPFDLKADSRGQDPWISVLRFFQPSFRPAVITATLAAAFFSRGTLREEFSRATTNMGGRVVSWRWFGLHLALLGVLIEGTLARRTGRIVSPGALEGGLLLWALIASAALVAWCFTLLPPRFWVRWIGRSRWALVGGAVVGFAAFALGTGSSDLWLPLQRSTFAVIVLLLRLLGQQTIVAPAELLVGTPDFTVTISSGCSGVEGIGLVTAFLATYLWYCRKDLRFPNALALIPLGVVAIWLLNAVRITALILLGNWNPDAALKGFHSVAGWLFFNAVAGGLVWASSHSNWLLRTSETPAEPNPATPYLLPMLVMIAASMLTRAFSPGLEGLYTAGAIVVLSVLYVCCAELLALRWELTWFPVVAGIAVAALWILLAGDGALSDVILAPATLAASPVSAWRMLGLVCGSIAAVAAEELAFRGYLFHRLIDADFAAVPASRFTWLAFLGSSAAFGIIHVHWMPATLAGMAFALIMYREGRLSDAIIAHVTSSATVLAYTMVGHR
jgi:exosortase E/protease (VPEID-CTERM system)